MVFSCLVGGGVWGLSPWALSLGIRGSGIVQGRVVSPSLIFTRCLDFDTYVGPVGPRQASLGVSTHCAWGEAGTQRGQELHSQYLLEDEADAVHCPQYPFPTPLTWKQNQPYRLSAGTGSPE